MSRFLDIENPDDRDLLLEIVGDLLSRHPRGIVREFGTVVSHGEQDSQALQHTLVHLPGDPEGHNIEAVNLLPNAPRRGDRVAVDHVPPHQPQIIGTQPNRLACRAANFPISTGQLWGVTARQALVDVAPSNFALSCGFDLEDSDDDGTPDTVVIPENGVYVVSAGAEVGTPIPNGADVELAIVVAGVAVSHFADHADSASHGYMHMSCPARVVYAAQGDTVYLSASDTVGGLGVSDQARSFLSIWQLCCDWEPLPPEAPPPE